MVIKKILVFAYIIFGLEFSAFMLQKVKIEETKISKTNTFSPKIVQLVKPKTGFGELMVLGESIVVPEVIIAPTPTPHNLAKNKYVVAAIGDSMVQTMGPSLNYLKKELNVKYPGVIFEMHNFGIGAEKITSGIERLPQVAEVKPDILILGSYSYNPFDVHDKNRHWLALSDFVNKARQITPNVYLLAEIAPLKNNFGQGPGGVNWPENLANEHVIKILDQLENTFGISRELNISIIDVYNKSTNFLSKYGQEKYVSSHDGIHPSVLGQELTASEIAKILKF